MEQRVNNKIIDLCIISLVNLMNLIMVGVFIARILDIGRLRIVGFVWVIFAVILGFVIVYNIRAKRRRSLIIIPILLFLFLIIEIVLDYVLVSDFRSTTLIGPYLLLYYVSILGMIGYSFLVKKAYGFFTLTTYFLSQIAAIVSYTQVGHG